MGTDCTQNKDSYWVECLCMIQIYYYIHKGTCTRRVTALKLNGCTTVYIKAVRFT